MNDELTELMRCTVHLSSLLTNFETLCQAGAHYETAIHFVVKRRDCGPSSFDLATTTTESDFSSAVKCTVLEGNRRSRGSNTRLSRTSPATVTQRRIKTSVRSDRDAGEILLRETHDRGIITSSTNTRQKYETER